MDLLVVSHIIALPLHNGLSSQVPLYCLSAHGIQRAAMLQLWNSAHELFELFTDTNMPA
jgi:hypothetical protein